jgi:hypothetical protein
MTAVSNATFTAAQYNASDRDNMLLTPAALATAANQTFVSTGVNAIAARTPAVATIATVEAFTPTADVFADITGGTVGPSVTVTTGTKAIVMFGALLHNVIVNGSAVMGFAVSGATTIAASLAESARVTSSTASAQYRAFAVSMPTLTAGSNTFTAKYTIHTGAAMAAADRTIIVFPL